MPDYNGNTYRYVLKRKVRKTNTPFLAIIKAFQKELRRVHKITFEFFLAGSAKKRLVTENNNNKGYDFDYRLLLHKGSDFEPEKLHKLFFAAMNKAINSQDSQYGNLQENSQAFTIKQLKEDGKAIDHSFDFVIIRKNKKLKDEIYEILYHNKKERRDYWQLRSETQRYEEKRNYIVKKRKSWEDMKKEYLKLKNTNMDKNKKSFSLYHEAINNVYHKLTKPKN